MSDLTKRLRNAAYVKFRSGFQSRDLATKAADEIDRLTAALANARDDALEEAWQAIKGREVEYEAYFEANEFKGMTLAAIAALASAAANVRALKEKP